MVVENLINLLSQAPKDIEINVYIPYLGSPISIEGVELYYDDYGVQRANILASKPPT